MVPQTQNTDSLIFSKQSLPGHAHYETYSILNAHISKVKYSKINVLALESAKVYKAG